MMTAKACRASYIAVYFSLPAAAVLLIFIRFFNRAFRFPYNYCVYHHDHTASILRHFFQENEKLRRAVIGRSFSYQLAFSHRESGLYGPAPESDSGQFKLSHISSRRPVTMRRLWSLPGAESLGALLSAS